VVATWGLQHIADVVELVALELVSVALGGIERAGIRPGCRAVGQVRLVSLRFQLDANRLVVATRDGNPHPPRFRQPGTGHSEPGELYFVPMLAEAWDFFRSGAGKVVWCELRIPAPGERWLPRRTPCRNPLSQRPSRIFPCYSGCARACGTWIASKQSGGDRP
jgi:hypothetical protein